MAQHIMDLHELIERLVAVAAEDDAAEAASEPTPAPLDLAKALSHVVYNSYRARDYSTMLSAIALALQHNLELPRLSRVG